MNAGILVPPSHRESLVPRRGQLLPLFLNGPVGMPPLSELKTMMVSFSIAARLRDSTTAPTDWSIASTMPAE